MFSRRENAKRFLREKTTSGRSYTALPLLASFASARYLGLLLGSWWLRLAALSESGVSVSHAGWPL